MGGVGNGQKLLFGKIDGFLYRQVSDKDSKVEVLIDQEQGRWKVDVIPICDFLNQFVTWL